MNSIPLFLDDSMLFCRENLSRRCTPMTEIASFSDGIMNTAMASGFVLRQPDGVFRLFYAGTKVPCDGLHYLTAVSEDGVHFRPDADAAARAGLEQPAAPNQFMKDLPPGGEIMTMLEDPAARPDARYKMLVCIYSPEAETIIDTLRVSPDTIHWTELPNVHWHQRGAEPIGSAVFVPQEHKFFIYSRPDFGDRRIAMIQTSDWETFSAPKLVMAPDSQDGPMAEHYGLHAFSCCGMMLGLLLVYQPSDHISMGHKFFGGTIRSELVYSRNGEFWQRTLRTPFVGGEHKMFWPSCTMEKDGYFYLYGSATSAEHGYACPDHFCSSLNVYRTPVHRFLSLSVDPGAGYGRVSLRQCILHNGTIHWNLAATDATCAIYEFNRDTCKTLRSHEECIPFTGDTTDWQPQWKGHDSTEDLKNCLLVFELRITSGDIWSLYGDFTLLGTTEAFRYHKFGVLPTRCGF